MLGAGISYEKNLSESIAIRGSLNYEGKYYIVNNQLLPDDFSYYIFQPVFSIEPRWYHNKNKRINNDKNVLFNASNFIGMNLSYGASWLNISNKDFYMYDSFSVSPTYNLRRNIKNTNLMYELGLGVKYNYYLQSNTTENSEFTLATNFKLSYVF